MASVGVAPTSFLRESSGHTSGVDKLPEEMNDMKIRDDKEMEATVVDGNGTETGHIIVATIGGRNGQPKQRTDFLVFAISDALALLSSSTSLLMFLSVLTARYAPEDFLLKLPRRLIIGLGSLFFAIITMMVAFGATLYMLLEDRWESFYIPIIALGCIPAVIFAKLQVPLFYDMVQSTYGSGVIKKKRTQ